MDLGNYPISGKISDSTNKKYNQNTLFGSVIMVIFIVLIVQTLSTENEKLQYNFLGGQEEELGWERVRELNPHLRVSNTLKNMQ